MSFKEFVACLDIVCIEIFKSIMHLLLLRIEVIGIMSSMTLLHVSTCVLE